MRAVLALAPLAILAVLLGAAASPLKPALGRPKYIKCGESSECGTWECCAIGTDRFSLPRCLPLADVGDFCSPGGEAPENATLIYPDNREVFLPAVHRRVCPCSPGLVCDPLRSACAAATHAWEQDADDLNAL